ncbi:endo-1,5-alpha-L-arabinanase [Flavihumibacter petaseus NBRC 106054]|uniref:Endo-1,5-alpha-L-arabinanase n=2 Tax=Flavihumibacter TaxID=1004301 RepID=A0A0E9N226_9BACT|nr:endo-1,5-alpha-L-arabinanase [Flavihumibacter petaseus NBRC 106054]
MIGLLPVAGYATDSLPGIHDPVIIREKGYWYVFGTGRGITVMRSADRRNWKRLPPVFDQPPGWAVKAVSGFKGHIWAPDIAYVRGHYYLFYAVSAFGKNTSCIGVASNKTLDPDSKEYHWLDHGKVIESVPGRDMWNAIDPNLILDEKGTPWLSFGSFWNGIKMVQLDSSLTQPATPQQWYTLAARSRNPVLPDSVAGDAAIEAPFIFHHNNYYYLFVSFDYCCRGVKSTYKVVVGRSKSIIGPYLDRDGVPMTLGGGTLVREGDANWMGIGHNAVFSDDGNDYLLYHGYDAHDNGKSKLWQEKIRWRDDWPEAVIK